MKTIGLLGFFFFLLETAVHAQLDALPGVYGGTLVNERTLSLVGTAPLKMVKNKTKTRVVGLGVVRPGDVRTTITVILPSRNVLNVGVDRTITIDFQQDPPTVTVSDPTSNVSDLFPIITVAGKVVTVVITSSVSDGVTTSSNVRTLKIVRTKP